MHNQTEEYIHFSFITDEILDFFGLLFKLIFNPALGVAGITLNFINTMVFFKMGLGDGVTQNFCILSISDGVFASVALINSVAYVLQKTVICEAGGIELEIQRVYWGSFFAVTFPQNVSLITTVVIAVVRCCCVAMPLRVKFVLTAKRQLAAILILSSAAIFVLVYVFSPMKTIYLRNPQTNKRFAVLVGYHWGIYTLFASVTFYTSFITVIVCVVILSINLSRSSRFRETSASGSSNYDSDGRRDTRVVKTVVLVAAVFVCCLTPHLLFSLIKVFIAEFSPKGRYRNENQLFLMVSETFLLLNTIVNIFIYLIFNTRYLKTFKTLFGKDKMTSKF
ncbi:hypothetical protein RRG08_063720 [Elysia crispata]|uniref:G-protein coupled receptors family 1 profile domain-containing protein n=1 Tax=Elysia crispata TaxID=231223 RepID=A0AAE1DMU8_9GAST|nr:hypothetical protein RRG08_063720 [Elysia crispata]